MISSPISPPIRNRSLAEQLEEILRYISSSFSVVGSMMAAMRFGDVHRVIEEFRNTSLLPPAEPFYQGDGTGSGAAAGGNFRMIKEILSCLQEKQPNEPSQINIATVFFSRRNFRGSK
jgi:hypothetical protein